MFKKFVIGVTLEGLAKAKLIEKTSWYVDSRTLEPPKNVSGSPQLAVVWIKDMCGLTVSHNTSIELNIPHATMLDIGKSGWTNGNPTKKQLHAFVESYAEHADYYLRNGIKGLSALDCEAVSIGWEYEK